MRSQSQFEVALTWCSFIRRLLHAGVAGMATGIVYTKGYGSLPPPENPCRGDPELYVQGKVTIVLKFQILSTKCSITSIFTAKYNVLANEISHSVQFVGACNPVEFSVKLELKWYPYAYPKTPHAMELTLTASLVIRLPCVSLPEISCGGCDWRGCRGCKTTWRRHCLNEKFSVDFGPFQIGKNK